MSHSVNAFVPSCLRLSYDGPEWPQETPSQGVTFSAYQALLTLGHGRVGLVLGSHVLPVLITTR